MLQLHKMEGMLISKYIQNGGMYHYESFVLDDVVMF
jgi:hypothetical protein